MINEIKPKVKEVLDVVGLKICAYLNGQGGSFFIDLSSVSKIKPTDQEINAWESYIRSNLKPSAIFSIFLGKGKLYVEVPQGKDIPYAYSDVVYLQDGETFHQAPIETIKDMIQRKHIKPERWERRFSLASLPDDLIKRK